MKFVARVRKVIRSGIHSIGHIRDGEVVAGDPLPLPDRVEIEVSPDSDTCMMYRYTRSGEFGGDTWHEDLESAFDQAEFEYGLTRGDFLVVHGSPKASGS